MSSLTVVDVVQDPEEVHEELFLYIHTDLESEKELELLDELDDTWRLDNLYQDKMTHALK